MSKKAAYNAWPPPPPDSETDEEHRTRLKIETDAKSKSDFIDHQLHRDREEWERQKKTLGVKVLLLGDIRLYCNGFQSYPHVNAGQSESGKSTVLKNFQLLFAPKAFELEVSLPQKKTEVCFNTFLGCEVAAGHSIKPCSIRQSHP